MKAAVLVGQRQLLVKETAMPKMEKGMILIKVTACGVCGSDIHMWKAGKGWNTKFIDDFHMGHEFCGIVLDSGDSDFKIGERVVFWANLYCGHCDMCQAGREHLCRNVHGTNYIGFVCNGGYAEYFAGPAKNAYRLPDSVSDLDAALIDPLMVAYHGVKNSDIKLHDKVLVVGSGIIAQLMGALIKKCGPSLLAMSKINNNQLDKARELGDFDVFLDANDSERTARYLEISKGGFDLVFEAVGNEASLQCCIDSVKPGGEIVAVGNSMTAQIPFSLNQLVLNEVRLKGSVSCTRKEFEETIDLIATGFIKPEKYVTDIVGLDELQQAFIKQDSGSAKMLKTVLLPNKA